jgi:metal-responsive CopG/Arc/MetJ family transcriptional regulator
MISREIHVKLTGAMLEAIDSAAIRAFQSRSQYIRETLALRLNSQQVVEMPTEDEFLKQLEEKARLEEDD